MLPEKIRMLDVAIAGQARGQLVRQSQFEFRYLDEMPDQLAVALLMPSTRLTYTDGDLFPVLDQNLPEGDLFVRLRAMFPKQPMTAMHLLALVGANGIGRLGFSVPGLQAPAPAPIMTREQLLSVSYTPEVFTDLINAYLSTGAGVAGMQPKIMVPDRPAIPIPTVIVKAGSSSYPGLAANEFLCLSAARMAGIETPKFDLSHDGQLLLVDRFDIDEQGRRCGFEDIASLMGLRVRDTLSDRKYQGSYERVAEVLRRMRLPDDDLRRFYEQVAFTVMVSNGDGHLKNYGVLYTDETDVRLAPMFDVVTTSIYRYSRYEGGLAFEDRTMALKLFSGKRETKTYPVTEELMRFGKEVCGVARPGEILSAIGQAMSETLVTAGKDVRVPPSMLADLARTWAGGQDYARDAEAMIRTSHNPCSSGRRGCHHA